ncbi:minor tail protein / capsid maturation protease [Corynebacterium phage CL31]|nr:minor tail protein / capsid maturation protease [Corynebacterium phage CL31]
MVTRSIPPLLADGGDMTVMRFVASHAFGKLSVTRPEGVEVEESDFDQAYSYKLRDGEVPPFGRRFIRADLDIDAENVTSTVEEVLDDVTNRTAGEALFQRDFSRSALGRLELGVDVNVGDLVPVRRWGRILENQLVTAADDISTPDDPFGVRIHVGGQLIREPAPLASKNRDIAREIAQERKERLAQVKAVDQKASEAKSSAENAKGIADSAQSSAENAKGIADSAKSSAENAKGIADSAKSSAENAKGIADSAKSSAENAKGIADSAKSSAENAKGIADSAKSSAENAKGIADSAKSSAENAKGIADSAQSTADAAKAESSAVKQAVVTQSERVDRYIEDTDAKIAAIGDVDAKIADTAAELLQDVEEAQADAKQALDALPDINSGIADLSTKAQKGIDDAKKALESSTLAARNGQNIILTDPSTGRPQWVERMKMVVDTTIEKPAGVGEVYTYGPNSILTGTSGDPVMVDAKVAYRYSLWVKADKVGSRIYIELRDQDGSHAVKTNTQNPSSVNHRYILDNYTVPSSWTKVEGEFTLHDGVTEAYLARWYPNHASGTVRDAVVSVADFRITPYIPAKKDVDDLQNGVLQAHEDILVEQSRINTLNSVATSANTTAIDALARAVRLAFPDINLLPYSSTTSTGYPRWYQGASWVSMSADSSNLPPVEKRSEIRSYVVAGSGTQAKTDVHAIELPADVREFRVRGYVRAASGYFPTMRVLDAANQDLITAWRNTAPSNDSEIAENFASGWVSTAYAGGGPMNADSVSDWVLYDQVVRIKDGAEQGWITLTTPSTSDTAYIHGLRMTVFYALQAEVDFGQQQSINALKKMIDINDGVTTKLTAITAAQGEQLEMLREIQKTQGEMVQRSMIMDLGSNVSSYVDDDGVFFRVYNNANNVDIEALGTWVGKAILTLVFGTKHETAMTQFSVPDGQSRRVVRSTQSRTNRKMARLDWWVYAKVQKRRGVTDTPEMVAPLGWSTLTAHNFTVETTTDHIIDFSVDWENTARGGKVYGIRIRRNGTVLEELNERNLGPNFPWESGRRTQSIVWSGHLTAGQNITFEVRTDSDGESAPTASQRTLGKRRNTITWMEDRKD